MVLQLLHFELCNTPSAVWRPTCISSLLSAVLVHVHVFMQARAAPLTVHQTAMYINGNKIALCDWLLFSGTLLDNDFIFNSIVWKF